MFVKLAVNRNEFQDSRWVVEILQFILCLQSLLYDL